VVRPWVLRWKVVADLPRILKISYGG